MLLVTACSRSRLVGIAEMGVQTKFRSEAAKLRVDGLSRISGELNEKVVRPSQTHRVGLQAAQRQRQQLINTKVMQFQIMASRE